MCVCEVAEMDEKVDGSGGHLFVGGGAITFAQLTESPDDNDETERIALVELSMRREAVDVKVRAEALFKQGSDYYSRKEPRLTPALICFEHALVANPTHWQSMLLLAKIHMSNNNYNNALSSLEDARALSTATTAMRSVSSSGAAAAAASSEGRTEMKGALLASCIYSMGECYFKLHNLPRAFTAFSDAVKVDPTFTKAVVAKSDVVKAMSAVEGEKAVAAMVAKAEDRACSTNATDTASREVDERPSAFQKLIAAREAADEAADATTEVSEVAPAADIGAALDDVKSAVSTSTDATPSLLEKKEEPRGGGEGESDTGAGAGVAAASGAADADADADVAVDVAVAADAAHAGKEEEEEEEEEEVEEEEVTNAKWEVVCDKINARVEATLPGKKSGTVVCSGDVIEVCHQQLFLFVCFRIILLDSSAYFVYNLYLYCMFPTRNDSTYDF